MFFSEAIHPGRISTVDGLAGEMLECLQKLDTLYERVNKFQMMLFLFTFSSFFKAADSSEPQGTLSRGAIEKIYSALRARIPNNQQEQQQNENS